MIKKVTDLNHFWRLRYCIQCIEHHIEIQSNNISIVVTSLSENSKSILDEFITLKGYKIEKTICPSYPKKFGYCELWLCTKTIPYK